MKQILLALALALTLSVSTFAAEIQFIACTLDKKVVSSVMDVNEELDPNHPITVHIQMAFEGAAKGMTVEELQSQAGFDAFRAGLDATDHEAIVTIFTGPTVIGVCE